MKMICLMMWQIIWLILTVIAETSEQQTGNSGIGKQERAYEKGVNEQFPPEIEERRRKLYPVLHQAKKDHLKEKPVQGRLYLVQGEYVFQEIPAPRAASTTTPARTRAASNQKAERQYTPQNPTKDDRQAFNISVKDQSPTESDRETQENISREQTATLL